MAKQELDEKLELEKSVGPKIGFSGILVSLLKFIVSIMLLPLVFGLTINLSKELLNQQSHIVNNFVFAIVAYVILHIFIYEPRGSFAFGQKIIDSLFGFFPILKYLLHYCLPVYSLLAFILYFIFKAHFGYEDIIGYFIFLISFTSVMHLVLTAVILKDETGGILRGDYFFTLVLVYLFDIILISIFLNVMLENFSFLNLIKNGFDFFINMHSTIFSQLFVLR